MVLATSKGDVGLLSDAANKAPMRRPCIEYGLGGGAGLGVVVNGVAMTPGSTMATRTLNGLSSCAKHSLNPSNAHFEAAYGPCGGNPNWPATEVILMMQPLRFSRMDRRTAWMHRRLPKKFVSITCPKKAIGASS